MLDQAADRGQELVEPARQLRGFILAAHGEVLGQVAFTARDAFQTTGNTVDRTHDNAGETGTDNCKDHRQHRRDDTDQPGQAGGRGHHFVLLDQADEVPAQLLGRVHIGHVAFAVKCHLDQTTGGFRQIAEAVAQLAQFLEVMLGLFRIDQHGAVLFHQHQIAAFAQFDLLDDVGQLLERYVNIDHAARVAQLVGYRPDSADQYCIVVGPVIGIATHGLAGIGHRRLVPRPHTRVVVAHFRVFRRHDVAAVDQTIRDVGVGRVSLGDTGEQLGRLPVILGLRGRRCAHVVAEIIARPGDQRVRRDVIDVLRNAVEKQLHGIVDLTNFARAAVREITGRLVTQIHDHDGGND